MCLERCFGKNVRILKNEGGNKIIHPFVLKDLEKREEVKNLRWGSIFLKNYVILLLLLLFRSSVKT